MNFSFQKIACILALPILSCQSKPAVDPNTPQAVTQTKPVDTTEHFKILSEGISSSEFYVDNAGHRIDKVTGLVVGMMKAAPENKSVQEKGNDANDELKKTKEELRLTEIALQSATSANAGLKDDAVSLKLRGDKAESNAKEWQSFSETMKTDLENAKASAKKWQDAYHSRPALIALGVSIIGGLIMVVGIGGAFGLAASIPFLAFAAGAVGRRLAGWGALIMGTGAAIYECWPYRWYIMCGAVGMSLLGLLVEHFIESLDNAEIERVETEIVNDSEMGKKGIIDYTDVSVIKYARLRMKPKVFEKWCKRNKIQ